MRKLSALRKWRHDQKLTQKQAAKRIGIAQSTISYLENGLFNPSLRLLKLLSKKTDGAVSLGSFV